MAEWRWPMSTCIPGLARPRLSDVVTSDPRGWRWRHGSIPPPSSPTHSSPKPESFFGRWAEMRGVEMVGCRWHPTAVLAHSPISEPESLFRKVIWCSGVDRQFKGCTSRVPISTHLVKCGRWVEMRGVEMVGCRWHPTTVLAHSHDSEPESFFEK